MEAYVTDLSTIKAKRVMSVEVMYRKILLVYVDGEVYAIEDRCPHLGVSLENGYLDNKVIKCKDHGLAISLETGKVIREQQADYFRLSKNDRTIQTYQVLIKSGKVHILME